MVIAGAHALLYKSDEVRKRGTIGHFRRWVDCPPTQTLDLLTRGVHIIDLYVEHRVFRAPLGGALDRCPR